MEHKITFLMFIFVIYSFIGWLFESLAISIEQKKIVNRGMLNLPICVVYGLTAIIFSIAFFDTKNIILIFIGSMIYATFMELVAGKILEAFNKGRWWDYSKKKFNLDGYVCLSTSLIFGLLGVLVMLVINPLLYKLFVIINYPILRIVLLSILIAVVVDFIITYVSLLRVNNNKVVNYKKNKWLSKRVFNRVASAYPIINKNKQTFSNDAFNVYKFLIYFVIGGILGCLCEMVFCRFTMHRWMSRSSLLFGEISLVWGLAIALFTIFLHMFRNKNNLFIFLYGVILGTSFEYLCGSFCEFFYGYAFWSYKHIPFNVNGRIQLTFALIWGAAAFIYIKFVYKYANKLIKKIPEEGGKIVVTIVTILLIFDVMISTTAGIRFSERRKELPPSNILEEFCDKYFTDDYMLNRFKNLKLDP